MLPYGEETESGEKGINLSGARRPRCRSHRRRADIVLMDDSLIAVDSYVG